MTYVLMIAGVWAVLIVVGLTVDWIVRRFFPDDEPNDRPR
jgi:hypothetical protein